MAKTPSVRSDIDHARATAAGLRAAEARLFEAVSADDARAQQARQALDVLLTQYDEAETVLAGLVMRIGRDVEKAYEDFHRSGERTRYENFVALFSRSRAAKLQSERLRQRAMPEGLRQLLLASDDTAAILADEKATAGEVQERCEAPLLALMEQRRDSAAAIETGRHGLKQINAALATVQWKLGSVTDDARRKALEAEREALSLSLEQQEGQYRELRSRHEALEEDIGLYETLSQAATKRLSAHTLLYNKLSVEMERGIQLYAAVSMSLDGLLREVGGEPSSAFSALFELLTLHAHNTVSLADIEKRRKPIDEALSRRYRLDGGRVMAIAAASS